MAAPQTINSQSQFKQLIQLNNYVIADFHATWCGPCHQIAPIYSALAAQNPAVTFTKIDVDAQQPLAREYGITAMPTFLVFKNGQVVETIRGANPSALRQAAEKMSTQARAEAAKKAQEAKKAEEAKEQPNDVSVSGSYGITKGSGWKMSLR
jgi:thioredoxin 1